jgi:hypothetical protein
MITPECMEDVSPSRPVATIAPSPSQTVMPSEETSSSPDAGSDREALPSAVEMAGSVPGVTVIASALKESRHRVPKLHTSACRERCASALCGSARQASVPRARRKRSVEGRIVNSGRSAGAGAVKAPTMACNHRTASGTGQTAPNQGRRAQSSHGFFRGYRRA